jgi:hypothetical protein
MSIKFRLTQYLIIINCDEELCYGEYCDSVLTSIIEFPSHPNINSDDFFEELKIRYCDIILYENDVWINELYHNRYHYLSDKYSNIKKIKFEYMLEKK